MRKLDLVRAICKKNEYTQAAAETIVDSFIAVVKDELKRGGEVRLADFGVFYVSERATTKRVNPRTGDEVIVPARKRPCFRAFKPFKDKLNRGVVTT